MEKVREVWYDAYKGFPIGGSCPQSGLMRGELTAVTRLWAATAAFPSSGLGRGLGHLPPKGKALSNYFLLGTSTALPPM